MTTEDAMLSSPDAHGEEVATPAEFIAFVFGYMELVAAHWRARLCLSDLRAEPVPLSSLRVHGIQDRMLMWMMYQAQLEHLQCLAASTLRAAAARPPESVLPRPTSAFALTDIGEIFADDFLADVLFSPDVAAFRNAWDKLRLGMLLPDYDKERRILNWGRHSLKRYRQPSLNQELILRAAEELHWPEWFDDPLPPVQRINPKVRLHDTIKCLNRSQKPYLIHFKGDGTGTRVGWEYR